MDIYSEHRKGYVFKLCILCLMDFDLYFIRSASVTTEYWIYMQD